MRETSSMRFPGVTKSRVMHVRRRACGHGFIGRANFFPKEELIKYSLPFLPMKPCVRVHMVAVYADTLAEMSQPSIHVRRAALAQRRVGPGFFLRSGKPPKNGPIFLGKMKPMVPASQFWGDHSLVKKKPSRGVGKPTESLRSRRWPGGGPRLALARCRTGVARRASPARIPWTAR